MLKMFDLLSVLNKELSKSKSILDVGCGRDSPIKDLNLSMFKLGLDFYPPYIKESKSKKIHDEYILHDVRKRFPFKNNSFDTVLCSGVLEHLRKDSGLKMIKEMERVARINIIIVTPNGFLKGHPGLGDNPDEKHLSGWKTEELMRLGFKVYGMNGLKFIRGNAGGVKIKPKVIFRIISSLSKPFTFAHPRVAFEILGLKEIN